MATHPILDVSNCQSVADVFRHPLPQVRQFHASLNAELDNTTARLRTLVGGSYRQLLGTAETILKMSELAQQAVDTLDRIGPACARSSIDGLTVGLAKLQNNTRAGRNEDRLPSVALGKALELCGLVIGKLLRKRVVASNEEEDKEQEAKRLVLAAKVLVVSRLLAKHLGASAPTHETSVTDWIGDSTKKLAALRQRLLCAIKRILSERVAEDQEPIVLIHALSAYSLATSASAHDVLLQFLQLRTVSMAYSLTEVGPVPCRSALILYARTIHDVQSLFPRLVAENLTQLKVKPLLQDQEVRGVEGLRLDEFETWFGDIILTFTPYIRHDDLDADCTTDILRQWTEKAVEVLMRGIAQTVDSLDELSAVVNMRTQILSAWIHEGKKVHCALNDPSLVSDRIRKMLNARMTEIIARCVRELEWVEQEVQETAATWKPGITDKHATLWDPSILEMEVRKGASEFTRAILARTHGRNAAVAKVFTKYQTWRRVLDEMAIQIAHMREQKWTDYLDDLEDDSALNTNLSQLTVDDPQSLQQHFSLCLAQAFANLQEKIESLLRVHYNTEQAGHISSYIIRILRDIRADLPHDAPCSFGISLLAPLYEKLVRAVVGDHLATFMKTLNQRTVSGRALWEGDPELPVQASPAVFRLLLHLTRAMREVGGDVWSPQAVRVLKEYVCTEASCQWTEVLRSPPALKNEGIATKSESEQNTTTQYNLSKDFMIQLWFDFNLISASAFHIPDPSSALRDLESLIGSQTGLDASLQTLVQASAQKYWNRASLLFGLLT